MRDFYEGEEGTDGWHHRNRSFLQQELVGGDKDIARNLANKAELRELQPNQTLYTKGEKANLIFFVLSGSCKLVDDGQVVGVLEKGKSLGEFPLVGESSSYVVTAIAQEKSVIAQVSYSDFRSIADIEVWQRMSAKLARRLNARD